MQVAESETLGNCRLILTVAINYGARAEITSAMQDIAARVAAGVLCPEDVNETTISQCLFLNDLPPPDLLIRTSGEQRISNFLLWQLAYTEIFFEKSIK